MADETQFDPMDVEFQLVRPLRLGAPPISPSFQERRQSTLELIRARYPCLNAFDFGGRDDRLRELNSRQKSHSREGLFESKRGDLQHLCLTFGVAERSFKNIDHDSLSNRHSKLIKCHPNKFPNHLALKMTDDEDETFDRAVRIFRRCVTVDITGSIYNTMRVRYFDPAGLQRGVDAGGLSAEFWTKIGPMFAKKDFFVIFPERENINWYFTTNQVGGDDLRAIGAMLAKALLTKATMPISLSPVVYKLLCGRTLQASDLNYVDPELWNRLNSKEGREVYISNEFEFTPIVQDPRSVKNPEDWRLDTLRNKDEVVTEKTYDEWVYLQCQFILIKSVHYAALHILKGFYSVIPQRRLVRYLTPKDLQFLIEGQAVTDATALLRRCHYRGRPESKNWFEYIVRKMNQEQLGKLLFFITGLRRLPRENRSIIINEIHSFDNGRLPSTHTCSSTMDMPEYETGHIMQGKLLQAIEISGFAFE